MRTEGPSPHLSIVLPCFNEEKNIRSTVETLGAWLSRQSFPCEMIVVDDGSTDATPAILATLIAEHASLRTVTHVGNRGYGAAVRSGIDAARGEIVGFMDSDGQFNPENFGDLLPLLTNASLAVGRRRRRADPLFRQLNAKLFGFLALLILGIWVRDINCAMKLWRRELWATIRPSVATGALVNAEMFYRLKRAGHRFAQIDVEHYPRKFGTQTGAKLSVILTMFRELWKLRAAADA